MRRNGFNGGSFLIGLLVGLLILVFLVFAIYVANNPTTTVVVNATPTPVTQGTQPAVPVTGEKETANPFRAAVDFFFQQVNLKIVQPFLAWLNGKPIVIQTTPEPQSTPLIIIATPAP